ncbi:hypothetical protein ID866_12504 [Astraeus odoratus]|nr:hypothetical protein ID866_12504 [Astraeus odoratus]
MRVLKVG